MPGALPIDDSRTGRLFHAGGPPEFDAVVAASTGRAEIDHHHAILVQIEDVPQLLLQRVKLQWVQLAAKDGILQRRAEAARLLVGLPEPLGIADIVADEKDVSHGGFRYLKASFREQMSVV